MLGQPFLRRVAQLYEGEISTDSRSLCFVFPNRRAAVFFRQYVSEIIASPVFSPELLTVNELFGKLSSLQQLDRIGLLQRLHACYVQVSGTDESFDEFVYWGDMLLADFNDVDKYLVDPEQLFVNVADLKALQDDFSYLDEDQRNALSAFWTSYFKGNEAEIKKGFKSSWDSLLPMYRKFTSLLESEGVAYEGMIYRKVAGMLDKEKDILPGYSRIVFVGLNALNECEKKLLDVLRDSGKADFYWDSESGMLSDPSNRASFFISSNLRRYPSLKTLPPSDMGKRKPNITVISVPGAVGQARYIETILSELGRKGPVSKETAVVLPDASLLNPAVSSIPDCVKSVNITMGYPLAVSELASFMDSLTELHLKCRYDSKGNVRFYYRPVLEILRHSYVSGRESSGKIISRIYADNMIYAGRDIFSGDTFLEKIFSPAVMDTESDDPKQIVEIADYLLSVLYELGCMLPGVEKDFVRSYHSVIMRVKDMNLEVRPRTLFRLIDSLVSGVNVPYRGEPLSGLQIMGPLETRALDFDNLIITSVNEGVFPAQNVASSFIPYTLRKGFGLPTYEYQDAIWAYYFYRLLSRAENVYLLCDSRIEGVRGGGESRYIRQLEYLYGDMVDFSRKYVSYRLDSDRNETAPAVIEKDTAVMDMIHDVFVDRKKPFSASSLNEYLDCPLKFYYARVRQMVMEETIEESAGYATFGNIYHKVMEEIYAPFLGRQVNREDLDGIGEVEDIVRRVMLEITRTDRIRGQNIINMRVIARMVEKTVAIDKGRCPFTIEGLEMKFDKELPVRIADKEIRVRMFGIADRVDYAGNVLNIIDYKTGSVAVDGGIAEAMDASNPKRPYTLLQLCFYQWLAERNEKPFDGNKCGMIYSLRKIFSAPPDAVMFGKQDIDLMLSGIMGIVKEIFDSSVPFSKGTNAKCEYCDFRSDCFAKTGDLC